MEAPGGKNSDLAQSGSDEQKTTAAQALNWITSKTGVLLEHQFAVISLVVGLAGVVLAVWQLWLAEATPQQLGVLLVVLAVVLGSSSFCLIALFAFQAIRIQRAAHALYLSGALAREQIATLTRESEGLRSSIVRTSRLASNVATHFHTLSERQAEYETRLAVYNSKIVSALAEACAQQELIPLAKLEDELWNEVDKQYRSLIATICETAVGAVRAQRGDVTELPSANIKLLIPGPTSADAPIFSPLRRSTGNPEREKHDLMQREHKTTIWQNKFYATVIRKKEPLIVPSLREYLDVMSAGDDGWGYREPNKGFLDLFQSCLLVPIEGIALPEEEGGGIGFFQHVTMRFGTERMCIGFLCIDSPVERFFEKGFDQDVMRQLANHVFACTRAHFIADLARTRIRQLLQPGVPV